MTDALQHSLHTAAASTPLLSGLAAFCANGLIVVAGLCFAALCFAASGRRFRSGLTRRWFLSVVVSGIAALLLVQVLGRRIPDPRPYLAEHYAPLAHVATDNGFPSDHTLLMDLLTGWVVWLLPLPMRLAGGLAFGALTVLVLLGRLAIGAHHTEDVLGSLLIAALSLGLGGWAGRFKGTVRN